MLSAESQWILWHNSISQGNMSSNPERENSHLWPEKFSERQYFVLCITWWHLLLIILTNFSVESLASVCWVFCCSCGFVRSSFAGNELKGDGVIKHWMEIRLCKVSLTIRHQVLPQGVYFRLSLLISISIPFTCVGGLLSFDWSCVQHNTMNNQQTWWQNRNRN